METMNKYYNGVKKEGKKNHFNPIKDFWAHDLINGLCTMPASNVPRVVIRNDTK
jgi:hypothetical protein